MVSGGNKTPHRGHDKFTRAGNAKEIVIGRAATPKTFPDSTQHLVRPTVKLAAAASGHVSPGIRHFGEMGIWASSLRRGVGGFALADRQKVVAVVDDDASVRTALGRLLRSAGYAVETFADGAEFISSLPSLRPDCIVLDLAMPKMHGAEVMERLAALGITVPVVIVTGSVGTELQARAARAGAGVVIRKPLDDQSLLDEVAAALRRRPADQAGT
jgi:CheY-like chemotaxis protein